MNAVLHFLPYRPAPRGGESRLPADAAKARQRWRETIPDADETALLISFVGLSVPDQHKALASFPGARRCQLADG